MHGSQILQEKYLLIKLSHTAVKGKIPHFFCYISIKTLTVISLLRGETVSC
jgi:hypothetical protein